MPDAALPSRSPAAVRLARRLRELREREYSRLTQEELGRALGGDADEGVSPATISTWENPASDRLPPPYRLTAYARLFCTPRSFEGAPRLIPERELTQEERERLGELRRELLELREYAGHGAADPAEPAQAGRPTPLWAFPDGAPITIVCGRLPSAALPPQADPADLNYVRMARFADLDALVDIYGAVKASNPDSLVILTTAKEMTRVDALNHLVLIGNTELNLAGRWFARHLELPVTVDETGVHRDGEIYPYTVEDGELIEDVGVFVRGPHPSAPHRTLTMCNGITTRGVRGAAQCFLNPTVRERNAAWIAQRWPKDTTYCVVMRVPVLNGEPLPQVLEDPSTRLYEWPEAITAG
jgi:transcriptional regulator with XRE-family HTH domain